VTSQAADATRAGDPVIQTAFSKTVIGSAEGFFIFNFVHYSLEFPLLHVVFNGFC
jgi:hypothetical protein